MIRFLLILFGIFYVSNQSDTWTEVSPPVITGVAQNGGVSGRIVRSTNTCVLPAQPDHGTYVDVAHSNDTQPGESYDTLILSVNCDPGFGFEDGNIPYGNSTLVLCVQGTWYQSMPTCVRFCKLEPDPSVDYMCRRPDMGWKPCTGFLPPGTVVNPVCKSPFYSSEVLVDMECIFGQWNKLAKCKADCGRVLAEGGIGLVAGGTDAKRWQVPWHVGIYRKTSTPYEQICGGSIVTNTVVISAAHCFWSNAFHRALAPSDFGVRGGKIYRPWDDKMDFDSQESDVIEIQIPSLYQGAVGHYGVDIAGLILAAPFVYNAFVRPVCLNFDAYFDKLQLQPGKSGKAAGWGLTSANGEASPILQVVDLPFIPDETCINSLPLDFRPYITGDKFCAGYTNGTALCKGDSGGGLAFPEQEQGTDRFYLRGIVSTAARSDNSTCNEHTYTAFTRTAAHREFIRSVITLSERTTCRGPSCSMVALGCGKIEKVRWFYIGSVISEKFILTSKATDESGCLVKYIAVGVKDATLKERPDWQIHLLKKIHYLPGYKKELEIQYGPNYYLDDIALLELETPIAFNTEIQPACLPEPAEEDVANAKFLLRNGRTIDVAKITYEECVFAIHASRELYLPRDSLIDSDSQLCYRRNSNESCYSMWSTAPLMATTQNSRCKNIVIGIFNFGISCDTTVFTRVKHYVPWIESIVGPLTNTKSIS